MNSSVEVRIHPGVQHPTLGQVGGWEGTVLREFSAGGKSYVDVEVSAKTIAGLSAGDKGRFYEGKIVFTRIRVSQADTETLPPPKFEIARADQMVEAQHEWFNQVGAHQQDPTQFVSDRAATGNVDQGRRQAMRSLVGIGVFMLFMMALVEKDCSCGGSGNGSWGRSGGFSS